jgi:SpoVK/Ycf46/Vps4 family AAA+-type ATPase
MAIMAPKLEKEDVDRLRASVLHELETRSIYKGRCLYTGNAAAPTFWCPFKATIAEELILPVDLQNRLNNEVYSIFDNIEECRKSDPSLLTRAFLYTGDYGTGKTQAMNIAAQRAMQNKITVIRHRPGDSLDDTQRMAALHATSLVQVEDVESYMPIRDGMDKQAYRTATTKILEAFDGALTKGREVLTIMTTNDEDLVAPGMSRTGRTDGLYRFHSLDRQGLERLIKMKLVGRLDANIDYDEVWATAHDMSSSFLAEIVKRSKTYLLGRPEAKLSTSDLVGIVGGLREHYDWHLRVKALEEGVTEPTMREYQAEIVRSEVAQTLEKILPDYAFMNGTNPYPLAKVK